MLHIPGLKLRLAFEGILVGVAAGLLITLLRLGLGFVAERRDSMVEFLQNVPPAYVLLWVGALVVLAIIMGGLVRWAPMAGGSGIPQVRGIVLGLTKVPRLGPGHLCQTGGYVPGYWCRAVHGPGRAFGTDWGHVRPGH